MSSVTDPQPDPAADEIVAYLDGELPPQDCRRVESRLATDDEYRQELHELDRAWEALDVLPASTVDDGFARTTIELACVAAEADLTDRTAAAKWANRNRMWRWIAVGAAAAIFGFLAGRSLIPHHNGALLADLPAIQQQNVLPYVEDIEFLRLLSNAVPPEQFVKEEPTLDRNLKELESANSPSFDTRREWVQSLPPERKAELADRTRAFADLEPASEAREHMRQVMEDIRHATDADKLQKTLVAYGLWLSRHTSAEKELLLEQLHDLSSDRQVAVVQRHLEQDERFAARHLKPEDAEKLRQEIIQIGLENKSEMQKRMQNARKGMRSNDDGAFTPQRSREAMSKRLVGKLSEAEQSHWNSLDRPHKGSQLWTWIQDAMKELKPGPEKLEEFFASDKLTPEQQQKLLDKPYANMEADLKRMYIQSELGIESPGQLFGDFGEGGRKPWGGPGMGGPREGPGPNRPPGFNPDREPRREGPPGERRPRSRPPRPSGDGPPQERKPEAI